MRTTINSQSGQFRTGPRLISSALSAALLAFVLASVDAPALASGSEQPKSYAVIFGTVWDPDGHPLYGVKVKIRLANEKKTRWELYSNHTGEFAQRVPVGTADYVVWADVQGYKLASGKKLKPGPEVTAHIDRDERCDIGLHLDW
jgi:hypothetical protein